MRDNALCRIRQRLRTAAHRLPLGVDRGAAMKPDPDNVQRLRNRSLEIRANADLMRDAACAATMRDLAATYERLAADEEDSAWKLRIARPSTQR
jgi:hypothetical protein